MPGMSEITRSMFQQAFEQSRRNLAAMAKREGAGRGVYSIEASTRSGKHCHQTLVMPDGSADLRSVSKVVVAMAIGAAIDRNETLGGVELSLDMRIAPFFQEYMARMPAADSARFESVRLRHLMSNTIGHRDGFLFRADVADQDDDKLLDYVFSRPLEFDPGEHFSYSNVGWYLISAMVSRETSTTIAEWAHDFILKPLGISDAVFKRYGPYEIAASGVCMANRDLHRLARLLADGGMDGHHQIVSGRWVDEMVSDVYVTDEGQDPARALQYRSYGLGLWTTADGWHYCDGSAGQLLAFRPSTGLAVSAVGDSASVTEVVNALQPLLEI
jgi:CubicO group peptidase (beta-lactamase class C family)